jgi:hypothetical protein
MLEDKVKRGVWVMLAGQGKSFTIFASILLFLKFTKDVVHVLFENKYLLNRDKKRFELAMGSEEFKARVKYHFSLDFVPEENSITVIDECDKHIYEACSEFKTKFEDARYLGFTGTAVGVSDESAETHDLVEQRQLELLGVEVFYGQPAN